MTKSKKELFQNVCKCKDDMLKCLYAGDFKGLKKGIELSDKAIHEYETAINQSEGNM